jgi:Heparinase II/III-like protein/Heparinase II/III N-terminus
VINQIRRLKGRSVAELRLRGVQAINARVERLRMQASLPSFPDSDGAKSLRARSLFDGLLDHSRAGADCVHQTAMALTCDDQSLTASLRRSVADIRAGRICLLGFGPLSLGNPPDWHRDAESGIVAPRRHWSRIPYLNPSTVGDHKIVWEVNRHQYLLAPALLWNIDGRTEDFTLVQSHLASWLEENPTSLGVNWCSSLEVAYRAIIWCWLLSLLPEPLWKQDVRQRLICALEHHGRHIERYLSYYFSPNTHLTGEALGLLYVGHVLPESRFARRWRDLGARILESWLPKQIYDDGIYFEQSSQYQRYTAEIYLHYLRISESNGGQTLATLRASLSRQFDVLRAMAAGQGVMPLIGDDDGGALLPIDLGSPEDLRGLLLAGATALHRPELVSPGDVHPAMAYWLCGVGATKKMLALARATPPLATRYFADGGLAIIRDNWTIDSAVAVIDAGRHGRLNCGHAHADALSCTLALGERPLFIDRGTLTYVGAERNEFRSTASHNTLEFDGESSVEPLGPFQWGPRPRRATATIRNCDEMTIFRSMAWGHAGTAEASTHSRVIVHAVAGAWLFLDRGARSQRSRMVLRWQLAPGLATRRAGATSFDVMDIRGDPVAHVALPVASSVRSEVRDVSPRYGKRCPAVCLEALADEHFRVVSLILPASSLPTLAAIRENADSEGNSLKLLPWKDPCGDHRIALPRSPGATFRHAGWEAEADLLWCVERTSNRTDSRWQPDLVVAIGARRLVPPGGGAVLGLDSELTGDDLVISNASGSWTIVSLNNPQLGEEHD